MSAQAFNAGAVQAIGNNLTNAVLQTPQAQQAIRTTASGIAQTGAVVVGGAMMAGHTAVAVTTATVAAGSALAVAAAPFVVAGACVAGLGYGVVKVCDWLKL